MIEDMKLTIEVLGEILTRAWPYAWPALVVYAGGFILWWVLAKINAEIDTRRKLRKLKGRRK